MLATVRRILLPVLSTVFVRALVPVWASALFIGMGKAEIDCGPIHLVDLQIFQQRFGDETQALIIARERRDHRDGGDHDLYMLRE